MGEPKAKLTRTGRWREWPPGSEQWAWYEPYEEETIATILEVGGSIAEVEFLHTLKVKLDAQEEFVPPTKKRPA